MSSSKSQHKPNFSQICKFLSVLQQNDYLSLNTPARSPYVYGKTGHMTYDIIINNDNIINMEINLLLYFHKPLRLTTSHQKTITWDNIA